MNLVAENDDFIFGPLEDSRVLYEAQADTEYVVVVDSFSEAQDDFRLDVSVPPPIVSEMEPNDDESSAQSVAIPARISGAHDTADVSSPDTDVYTFEATAGQRITVDVLAAEEGLAIYPTTEVRDSQDNRLMPDESDFYQRYTSFTYDITETGEYLLSIEPGCSQSRCSTNEYSIHVTSE